MYPISYGIFYHCVDVKGLIFIIENIMFRATVYSITGKTAFSRFYTGLDACINTVYCYVFSEHLLDIYDQADMVPEDILI